MKNYLYIFGFESPKEKASNEIHGTDFESSVAIWIEAGTKEEALIIGQTYATEYVDKELKKEKIKYEGWRPQDYANWIEDNPLENYSGLALEMLERIEK